MDLQSTFLEAVRVGDMDAVDASLMEDPSLAASRDKQGVSAPLLALYHGHAALAQRLASAKASLDLFEAAALGDHAAAARALEADPASVNTVSPDGFSPLGLAAFFGHERLTEQMLEHGAAVDAASHNTMKVQPIHSAAAQRDPALSLRLVQLLVAAGAPVNVRQQGGWTPLHQAAAHGNEALVSYLLAEGADPAPQAGDGRTPADLAAANGHARLAERLREGGTGKEPA